MDIPVTFLRRSGLHPGAHSSNLYLWIALMVAPVGVLAVGAVSGGGDSWILILKYTAALLLAVIPGWIYVLFIKNKGPSLYDEYVLNLFRLKIDAVENLPAPPQHTNYYRTWNEAHARVRNYLIETNTDHSGTAYEPTKDNLYRKKFETIYGQGSVSTIDLIRNRTGMFARTETFSPVLFATLLMCLGWVLILPPRDGTISLLNDNLSPDKLEALKYAFLGAYAFTLQDLVRRYFRDDLRAGAYLGLIVRLVFTGLIVTAAGLVLGDGTPIFSLPGGGQVPVSMALIAFVIGFFPQAGLQLILDAVRRPLGKFLPKLRTDHPLCELDGLNIWYETRLGEEGIDDMQTLTSANFVDLMLKTRAPLARLVDWMDQAYLALHVWPITGQQGDAKPPARSASITRLRGLGIRTATDLEMIWAARRDDPAFRRLIGRALGVDEEEGPGLVEAILVGLKGETNLGHIREFRRPRWLDDRPLGYPGSAPRRLEEAGPGRPRAAVQEKIGSSRTAGAASVAV